MYMCDYCNRIHEKEECHCSHPELYYFDERISVNSIVKLKKEEFEKFYGRDDRIGDYMIGGIEGELSSEHFINFVGDYYRGFYSGDCIGMVEKIDKSTAKVLFYNYVKESIDFGFFGLKELDFIINYSKKDENQVKVENKDRMVVFQHAREYDYNNDDYALGNYDKVKPKGGYTYAIEIPKTQEFLNKDNVTIKFGMAKCHPDDVYSKKIGRDVATANMKDIHFKIEESPWNMDMLHLINETEKLCIMVTINKEKPFPRVSV